MTETDISHDVHPNHIYRTNHSSLPADADLIVGGNYVHSKGKLCKEDQADSLDVYLTITELWDCFLFLLGGLSLLGSLLGDIFFIGLFKESELLLRLNNSCARRWCGRAPTRCDVWCFNKIKGPFKQMMLILSGQSLFISAEPLCSRLVSIKPDPGSLNGNNCMIDSKGWRSVNLYRN